MSSIASVGQTLDAYLPQFKSARHIYIAFSGGLDSHVLLHGMATHVGTRQLTALHINHQMSPNAAQWDEHCRLICQSLEVKYIGKNVRVPTTGSRENAAREARYQAFEEQLASDDLLLLAHHADDQAETILYRLLRRSGPRGLAGMPVSRPLGEGVLLRPLLGLTQAVLEDYAFSEQLQWVEDESNSARQFDRNFLRHEIIPQLKTRWPSYAARIAGSGALCGQSERLNQDLAEQDMCCVMPRGERQGWSIDIGELVKLSSARQANVLRHFARSKALSPPGHRVVDEVLDNLLEVDAECNPLVVWAGGEWRRFRQRLYLLPAATRGAVDDAVNSLFEGQKISWSATEKLQLPDGGILSAEVVRGGGLAQAVCQRFTVSFRQGGERCRPTARIGSASLKKLFQEFGLEPWLRSQVPLIYCDGELAAVGDLWICEGFQARVDEPGFQLNWRYPSED